MFVSLSQMKEFLPNIHKIKKQTMERDKKNLKKNGFKLFEGNIQN